MHFTLRPWKQEDLQTLVRIANNPLIAKNLTDKFPHPYTEADGKSFLEMALAGKPVNIFCIDINNAAAGGIGLHPMTDVHRKNAEMGYWLAEEYWGHGIIPKAITQMVEYGFKNFEIDRIFARPYGSNLASQKVLEKAGFKLEARLEKTLFKNGVYEDEVIYSVRRKP